MKDLKDLKVALVHDYLTEFGGAEGVFQAEWELFPGADIYTAAYDPEKMKKVGAFQGAKIHYPQWRPNIGGSIGRFVHLLLVANLPLYFENLDLRQYDLVISDTAHFAKGVLTTPEQLHISYIHTPPRSLYGYKGESSKRDSRMWRILLAPLDSLLRVIDYNFAQRPDFLLCNSQEIKARIKKFYGREATVINPFPQVRVPRSGPEAQHQSSPGAHYGVSPLSRSLRDKEDNGYYLVISRMAAYKNIDLIIRTCGERQLPLKVAGTGSSDAYLRQLASRYPSVEMLGLVSEEEKVLLYQNCKAVIGAVKDEDFGMAALEPMVFGKPAVVLREAGYLETVIEGVTGVFFNELTEASLLASLQYLETLHLDPEVIKTHAAKFSKERFQREFKDFVVEKLATR